MGFFGLLAAFWGFNDHFLSIREHSEYKQEVAVEITRLGTTQQWVLEHKLGKDTFEDHITQDADRRDRLEKQIDDLKEEMEILKKRLDDFCKKK